MLWKTLPGTSLDAPVQGGRFGHTVASLMDLNNDKYCGKVTRFSNCKSFDIFYFVSSNCTSDFVVGAPYASGGGAVFIYMGGKMGPVCVKKIIGRDFDPKLSGFGFSFSRPVDVDNNGFNGKS
jgi:hypothetical protein